MKIQQLEATLVETTERSCNFEVEISQLRDMARRHIDCESIREAHSTCNTTIDSLHQQREQLEETVASLRNDVHRLALENNHSNEVALLNDTINALRRELEQYQQNEPALQNDLAESRARASKLQTDAGKLDLIIHEVAVGFAQGNEKMQSFRVNSSTIYSSVQELFRIL